MASRWNHRRFILILSVTIIVSALVMWLQASEWDIKPLKTVTSIHHISDRRWKPSNPAMTTCIGYGNPKTADFGSFCEIRMPNTIIIGVVKCGTQALLTFLGQHPQIVRNTDINSYRFFNEYYANGREWYRDRIPYSLPGQVVIERTPSYFADKHVPERVFNVNPKMKLLLAVRNPVDRYVSEYTMHNSFHDTHKSLRTYKGLKPEDRFPQFELIWEHFMNMSYYDTLLENWLQYFRIEQIHVVDGDVLRKSPLQELKKIEQFLNIEPYFHKKHFYLNTIRGMFCISKPRFGQEKCLKNGKGRKHPKVNETVLQIVRDILRPHNQRFYKLSMKHFSWDNDTSIK